MQWRQHQRGDSRRGLGPWLRHFLLRSPGKASNFSETLPLSLDRGDWIRHPTGSLPKSQEALGSQPTAGAFHITQRMREEFCLVRQVLAPPAGDLGTHWYLDGEQGILSKQAWAFLLLPEQLWEHGVYQ